MIHGRSAYNNHGCRCDTCRAAAAAYAKQWRQKARTQQVPAGYHGTASTYRNRGCRCDPCKQAKVAKQTEWRQRNRQQ